jgi:hypothetical protein
MKQDQEGGKREPTIIKSNFNQVKKKKKKKFFYKEKNILNFFQKTNLKILRI